MNTSRPDDSTVAFRRVLSTATTGEHARVDALLALADRTLYVATWPAPHQAARTLTNGHGESAMPLFTGLDTLEPTATRFGWRESDGSLQFRVLTAQEALEHALAREVHFVVIDIGSDHSVEFAREELEPLVQIPGPAPEPVPEPRAAIRAAVRRHSTRPPRPPLSAALPHIPGPPPFNPIKPKTAEQTVPSPLAAARLRTPPPNAVSSPRSTKRLHGKVQAAVAALAHATNSDEPTSAEMAAARQAISASALAALYNELQAFPEIEWACVLADGSDTPQIGVRIDPSFLNRVADITDAIMDVGEKQSQSLQVLLLNNPDLVERARKSGHAFYPGNR